MANARIETDTAGVKVARGVLAGLVAGVVASLAMDGFQAVAKRLMPSDGGDDSEPATEQAADAVARATVGAAVPQSIKPFAGQAVHYALGAGLGLGYAIAAEFRPTITKGNGAAFAIGTATLLDEAAVPAVGLGEAPWKARAATTLYAYASHLVFGTVTELVRRQVRASLVLR